MPTVLVTGGSRGVGRGVALGLSAAGFTVFATGRSIESADLPPSIVRIRCDHARDDETTLVFQRIAEATEGLDVLVNSAWGGYERMMEDAAENGWLDLSNSESPEFIGRVIAALNAEPNLMKRSGKVVIAAQVAKELGVLDIDGKQPIPLTLDSV